MSGKALLDLGAVADLRIAVTFGTALDRPAHDVFMLDVHPRGDQGFHETPYLAALEPVLSAGAAAPERYSVQLRRTRLSWFDGGADAELVVTIVLGQSTAMGPRVAVDTVAGTFRRIVEQLAAPTDSALYHDDAINQARRSVAYAYAGVSRDRLSVTDEEHRAASGSWSIGLATPDLIRFQVTLGFVGGIPGSTHITRSPASEVVDSVGSEN